MDGMVFQERSLQNSIRLFVAISVLFHLALMALLAIRWPASQTVSHPQPIIVSVIDPAELNEILIGKETNLPPKPKDLPRGDLTTLPRSTVVPQQGRSSSARSSQSRPNPSAAPEFSDALSPAFPGPLKDTRSSGSPPRAAPSPEAGTSSSLPAAPSAKLPETADAQTSARPVPRQSIPGLPFADQKDLDKLAKVYTEQEMPKRDSISINTEELRYLSYMLRLKQRIELIWQYPPGAVAARLQGDLLLNFTIQKDGQLTEVSLIRSSGYRVLDEEAIRAVKSASPYAPLPESWHQERITITGNFLYYESFLSIR